MNGEGVVGGTLGSGVVGGGVRVVLRGFGDSSWLVLGTSCGSGCSAG